MVARLKLKEIDGRAPPGVNLQTLLLKAACNQVKWLSVLLTQNLNASHLLGGDTLKLRGTPRQHAPKEYSKEYSGASVTAGEIGKTHFAVMDNPQPSPYSFRVWGRFRDLTGVGFYSRGVL
jgi:hypothetical protein